jgi:hypothetical protein
MKRVYVSLVLVLITASGCTAASIDQFFGHSETRNGSLDTECRHVGVRDTGHVENCSRHNDDREREMER